MKRRVVIRARLLFLLPFYSLYTYGSCDCIFNNFMKQIFAMIEDGSKDVSTDPNKPVTFQGKVTDTHLITARQILHQSLVSKNGAFAFLPKFLVA